MPWDFSLYRIVEKEGEEIFTVIKNSDVEKSSEFLKNNYIDFHTYTHLNGKFIISIIIEHWRANDEKNLQISFENLDAYEDFAQKLEHASIPRSKYRYISQQSQEKLQMNPRVSWTISPMSRESLGTGISMQQVRQILQLADCSCSFSFSAEMREQFFAPQPLENLCSNYITMYMQNGLFSKYSQLNKSPVELQEEAKLSVAEKKIKAF